MKPWFCENETMVSFLQDHGLVLRRLLFWRLIVVRMKLNIPINGRSFYYGIGKKFVSSPEKVDLQY